MTTKAKDGQKRRAHGLLVLLLFALTGQFLFGFFGISVHGFRMVGGILFFMLGYDMLQARLSAIRVPKEKTEEYVGDISITPLAVPMITGPGSITNAIVLMEDASSLGQSHIDRGHGGRHRAEYSRLALCPDHHPLAWRDGQ